MNEEHTASAYTSEPFRADGVSAMPKHCPFSVEMESPHSLAG